MKTKLIRVEQKTAYPEEVDKIVNKEIKKLEEQGHSIKDVRVAVGRDAWEGSGIDVQYSITIVLLYE